MKQHSLKQIGLAIVGAGRVGLMRGEIAARGDRLPSKTLLYVDDAVELFFLQVQGSGRLELDDGSVMAVGFAGHNSQPYRSIGRVLIERGELTVERASMQGIKAWARANPSRVQELLNQNPRYVFFREEPLKDLSMGPLGAQGLPLTAGRSIAVDPQSLPYGTPLWLASEGALPLRKLVLAQDTGNAIVGAVRADYFVGSGEAAGEIAGRVRQELRLWALWPR